VIGNDVCDKGLRMGSDFPDDSSGGDIVFFAGEVLPAPPVK
jgi:hypothetical protein